MKQDVKQYLYDHTRMPAWKFEAYPGEWTAHPICSLKEEAERGIIPTVFYASDDPHRLGPIGFTPDDFMLVVAGEPLRTNAYTFTHNGILSSIRSRNRLLYRRTGKRCWKQCGHSLYQHNFARAFPNTLALTGGQC